MCKGRLIESPGGLPGDLAPALGQRAGAVVTVPVEQVRRGLPRGRRAPVTLADQRVAVLAHALRDNITH